MDTLYTYRENIYEIYYIRYKPFIFTLDRLVFSIHRTSDLSSFGSLLYLILLELSSPIPVILYLSLYHFDMSV